MDHHCLIGFENNLLSKFIDTEAPIRNRHMLGVDIAVYSASTTKYKYKDIGNSKFVFKLLDYESYHVGIN